MKRKDYEKRAEKVRGSAIGLESLIGTCLAKGCTEAVAADPDATPPVDGVAGVDYSVNLVAVE